MSDRPSMFHAEMRALQDRYDGRRVADALEKNRRLSEFGPDWTAFIEGAEFFMLATAHGGSVDCSFKGGPPGFVEVLGPTALRWRDFDGNSMYRSLGNLRGTPRAGLLFLRFGPDPARLRVNGAVSLEEVAAPGGPRLQVTLEAEEIFPNCPRYIPDLAAGAPSPYHPGPEAPGAKPDWKERDYIRDILPEGDPHRG